MSVFPPYSISDLRPWWAASSEPRDVMVLAAGVKFQFQYTICVPPPLTMDRHPCNYQTTYDSKTKSVAFYFLSKVSHLICWEYLRSWHAMYRVSRKMGTKTGDDITSK